MVGLDPTLPSETLFPVTRVACADRGQLAEGGQTELDFEAARWSAAQLDLVSELAADTIR